MPFLFIFLFLVSAVGCQGPTGASQPLIRVIPSPLEQVASLYLEVVGLKDDDQSTAAQSLSSHCDREESGGLLEAHWTIFLGGTGCPLQWRIHRRRGRKGTLSLSSVDWTLEVSQPWQGLGGWRCRGRLVTADPGIEGRELGTLQTDCGERLKVEASWAWERKLEEGRLSWSKARHLSASVPGRAWTMGSRETSTGQRMYWAGQTPVDSAYFNAWWNWAGPALRLLDGGSLD